ncbi:WD domain G-beta repeat domain-containing protein [Phytophthora infestans]|uniref:WD domain G-beta repeat domain-containing protein n=1 Tax=Phytophthora infestans TaxID=4787 RepID=A0A8S9UN31_PHYIN|nr:WD domain G-beta repeat domain-containing protein [Phytophthora infestans]
MHRRRHSTKNAQTSRFSLLLLEDGEFFLDDHSACRFLEPNAFTHRRVFGRIKVCTRGLFFVPHDLLLPILRFPFRSMVFEPVTECFLQRSSIPEVPGTGTEETALLNLTFQMKQVIEMRERGIDHPYIYKDTTDGMEITNTNSDIRSNSSSSLNGEVPAKYIFTLQHVTYEAFLASIHVIFEVSNLPRRMITKTEEETLLAPVLAPRMTDKFDPSLLIDFRERLLMETGCVASRIEPLLKFPGCLMLTTLRLYFQPSLLNNVLDPVLNWEYTNIDQVYKRRYLLRQIGLEIYLRNGDSFFFSFRSRPERDDFYALMVGQPELQRCRRQDLQNMMRKWQRRELSNFEYLRFLNNASGRTRNDLTQYPIFPWILCDYTGSELDLNDPKVYRDLSKPIGALNEERLEYFKARFDVMPRGDEAEGMPPPFLYGTHYSTPGYVLYFLVRKVPECMLCLQSGKFDAPDRLFRSIKRTWDGCVSNHTDVKELIPEFFDCALPADEWLRNQKHLDLGTTQSFDRVDDVELPPWAHGNAIEFVRKNRAALESDYVSENLHHWIDLIFGYKQQGEEAVKANNLFYYLSYEGSVDLETIDDPVEKSSLEAQIQEFGQTPKLLFSTPHPSRNEGEGKIEVATPDLLLSPRVVVPRIRRVSIPLTNASDFRPHHRKEFTFSAFEDYTESEDEVEEDTPSYRRKSRHQYSLICCQSSWNRLPKAIAGLSTHLWGSISSGKPLKNWRWTSRLRTKYSLSSSYSWKQMSKCQLHKGEVTSTILSKDNSFLLTTSKDKTLKLSSTQDVAHYRDVSGKFALSCCDISPDESVVLVGSWDNSVYMYSTSTGQVLDKVFAHSDGISAIRVLQDRFVTSSWDSSIKFWRYTSRFIVATPIRTFLDCEESVLCLDVSRDGRCCAAGTRKGVVYLFNLSKAVLYSKTQASLHGGGISSIAFAQDNNSYVCATVQSELLHFSIKGERLWSMDIRTAGQVRCFDSDGKYAVGGTTAGKILFWKLQEQAGTELVYEIPQAHGASISSLAVGISGSIIVSGAVDGSVHVWKLQKKIPLPRPRSSQALARLPVVNYGSIQTSSTTPTFSKKKTPKGYVPNATAQLAEAECWLEF